MLVPVSWSFANKPILLVVYARVYEVAAVRSIGGSHEVREERGEGGERGHRLTNSYVLPFAFLTSPSHFAPNGSRHMAASLSRDVVD